MKREDKYQNTDSFIFYNANPKGRLGSDCVIRAISTATGQSWEQTVREMTEFGIQKGLVLNDAKLYPLYLKEKGFKECSEPRNWDNTKMTVKTFCRFTREDCVVANVGSHHVVAIINKKVLDTWDSSSQTMHKYWKR